MLYKSYRASKLTYAANPKMSACGFVGFGIGFNLLSLFFYCDSIFLESSYLNMIYFLAFLLPPPFLLDFYYQKKSRWNKVIQHYENTAGKGNKFGMLILPAYTIVTVTIFVLSLALDMGK